MQPGFIVRFAAAICPTTDWPVSRKLAAFPLLNTFCGPSAIADLQTRPADPDLVPNPVAAAVAARHNILYLSSSLVLYIMCYISLQNMGNDRLRIR